MIPPYHAPLCPASYPAVASGIRTITPNQLQNVLLNYSYVVIYNSMPYSQQANSYLILKHIHMLYSVIATYNIII